LKPSDTSPLGLLGGTFDPIHNGHLRLAEEVADALGLSEIRFIPAGNPPHRAAPRTPALQRLDMVRAAVAGNPRFSVDDREVRKTAPSYTVETLAELRAELDGRPLCLLMGGDAFLGLDTWHRWQALFDYAHVVVATRPGALPRTWRQRMSAALRGEFDARRVRSPGALRKDQAGRILCLATCELDISATRIRAQVAAGRSPRYLVPEGVVNYIRNHKLYEEEPDGTQTN
jgi:nicotinate-nucleotide adenylyltransferase